MTTVTEITTPTEWSAASLFVQNTLCFNTRRDYAAEVRLFARWVGKGAQEITLADLLAYREHLESKRLKPATVAKKITVLRRLFVFLHEQGLLPRNPAAGLKLPKVRDESSKDILTLEECRRLLDVIDTSTLRGKRDLAITILLLLSGLRTCEICRANIGDLRQVEEYIVLKVHGKGNKEAETRIRDDM
jgi:site-specific recombinase XerD